MDIMYLSWRCLLCVYSYLKPFLKWPSQWPTKFVVSLIFVRRKETSYNPHCLCVSTHLASMQCRLPLFFCRNYIKELAICIQSDQPTPETMKVIKNLGECMGRVTPQVIFKWWFVSTSVERQLVRVSLIFNKVLVSSM